MIMSQSLLLLKVCLIMILLTNYYYIKLLRCGTGIIESKLFFDEVIDLNLGFVSEEGHIYNLEYETNLF